MRFTSGFGLEFPEVDKGEADRSDCVAVQIHGCLASWGEVL
jgi:hypothetical protein